MTDDVYKTLRQFQSCAPVDLEGLANSYGIRIERKTDWPDDISGRFSKTNAGSASDYLIEVNGKHASTRQRFTIAHEIGHFLLHREDMYGVIEDDGLYRSRLSNRLEAQANRMAADILMPHPLIKQLVDDEGIRTIKTLAQHLGVSQQALRIRLGIPVP